MHVYISIKVFYCNRVTLVDFSFINFSRNKRLCCGCFVLVHNFVYEILYTLHKKHILFSICKNLAYKVRICYNNNEL